jgi:hypothetical protein
MSFREFQRGLLVALISLAVFVVILEVTVQVYTRSIGSIKPYPKIGV